MTPTGFGRPTAPAPPFSIFLVTFLDLQNEPRMRRTMAAFTTEEEAHRMLRHLQKVGTTAEERVELIGLYKRFQDWASDPEDDHEGIPGLNQAKVILPAFKGHTCGTVALITQRPGRGDPVVRGIEVGWKTGAVARLSVPESGTLHVSGHPWSGPSRDQDPHESARAPGAGHWHVDPVDDADPLSRMIGKKVLAFSVTENPSGTLSAIEVGYGSLTWRAWAVGDDLHWEVVEQ